MANEEQLKILKQGVDAWNQWRGRNPDIQPDLTGANLSKANLIEADLRKADLSEADLSEAELKRAKLIEADLSGANLTAADLTAAYLSGAYLIDADLRRANLTAADLTAAQLTVAYLSDACLSWADLSGAYLIDTDLSGADLSGAMVGWSTFANIDLSAVKGLDTVKHAGPSTIGIDTIYRSKGNIPEVFLRGAGLPDTFIAQIASLVEQGIQFYPCFISYSSKDQVFAKQLHADMESQGVRCWFAPEDMKLGARIRLTLDESIRAHDRLLLILSKHSIASQRVEQEVETALARERKEGRTVLLPIRLDDAVMEIESGWPAFIRNAWHIGDFRHWKSHDEYQKAFNRLLRDLQAEELNVGERD